MLSGVTVSMSRPLEKLGPALTSPKCVEVEFSKVRYGLSYSCITDSAGREEVKGPACRCTTFQLVPSSGLRTIVTRRSHGVTSSLPPTTDLCVGPLYPHDAG